MLVSRMDTVKCKVAALDVVFEVVEGRNYGRVEEGCPRHSSFGVKFGIDYYGDKKRKKAAGDHD